VVDLAVPSEVVLVRLTIGSASIPQGLTRAGGHVHVTPTLVELMLRRTSSRCPLRWSSR
jgi:hypothetical protein